MVGVSTSVDLRLAVAPDQAKLVSDFVADLQERGWKTMVLETSSTYPGSTAPGGLVRYVTARRGIGGADLSIGPERPHDFTLFLDHARYEDKPDPVPDRCG